MRKPRRRGLMSLTQRGFQPGRPRCQHPLGWRPNALSVSWSTVHTYSPVARGACPCPGSHHNPWITFQSQSSGGGSWKLGESKCNCLCPLLVGHLWRRNCVCPAHRRTPTALRTNWKAVTTNAEPSGTQPGSVLSAEGTFGRVWRHFCFSNRGDATSM